MSVWLNSLSLYVCHLLIFSRPETANAQKYQLIKGYNLWDNSLLWEDKEPHSLIQCLIICKQTERCCCVVLTSSTGKCSYYDWFKNESEYLAVEDGDSDDIMILVKPIPGKICTMAQYNLFKDDLILFELSVVRIIGRLT